MDYVIETNNLVKQFPNKLAVDHVSMHVKKGDIYGFIGKNGAGKTTTMKLILGLINPSEGEIKLFGSKDLNKYRSKIGSLIEAPGLYKNATAFENMKRFSILYGGTDAEIKEILSLVGLGNVGSRKAGNFSLGMRQRLGIAIALLGNPEILILDEPINGLDPAGIKEIRDTIIKLNKERNVTFLISSHLLDELAKITTRYGIVNDGRLVEEIGAEELSERCKQNLKIRVSDVNKAIEVLKKNQLLDKYNSDDQSITMFSNFDDPASINELLVKAGIKVEELSSSNSGFEDYFIERIGR
ncbi:MAG: ABC transporter ATP-binding protein [Clostridia bacterium]|nr:ABC transporter ATP-binding protein [Clostridia bacterium]